MVTQLAFWVGEGCLCLSVRGLHPFLSLGETKPSSCLFSPFHRESTFTAFIVFALWFVLNSGHLCLFFTSVSQVFNPTFSTNFP